MIEHPTFDAGFGIYVHWPFCAAKCPYCDFNSHVRHKPVDQQRFASALRRELTHMADIGQKRQATSIFFGGGTPSLMLPETLEDILNSIASIYGIADNAEITLEANPTSVEAERFKGYRAAGVNRVSMGIQALNDKDLKRLGRMHSADEAKAAIKVAAENFDRFSFDLIYARPNHEPAAWRAELLEALSLAVEHLSLYQLTIEPGTWYQRLFDAGKITIPDDETARILYDITQEVCDKAGLPAYEISNHARPGAESRHNQIYWRYGEYVGVGAGAHGRMMTPDGRLATATEKSPEEWLERVEQYGHGIIETELLDQTAQGDEYLLMGLRLSEGIDVIRHSELSGKMISSTRIDRLVEDGLLERRGNRGIAVPTKHFAILNSIIADLASD
ncbi:radical SAM family heme chaperone HemW [Microvirga sp. W0021]|uniref:Heme chaperone HemW n=1 Tax=Hohaiivirga grylli TaxID=3133970 RepID=A0ABV0BIF0_9HYPH